MPVLRPVCTSQSRIYQSPTAGKRGRFYPTEVQAIQPQQHKAVSACAHNVRIALLHTTRPAAAIVCLYPAACAWRHSKPEVRPRMATLRVFQHPTNLPHAVQCSGKASAVIAFFLRSPVLAIHSGCPAQNLPQRWHGGCATTGCGPV